MSLFVLVSTATATSSEAEILSKNAQRMDSEEIIGSPFGLLDDRFSRYSVSIASPTVPLAWNKSNATYNRVFL